MDDYTSRKVSVSVRNAISVNSTKSHQLEKRVKNLEAERDMRLLNLQMKKDDVFFSSPSTGRRKILVKSPSVSEGLRAATPFSQEENLDLNTGLRKEHEVNRLHNLPPLHLDRAGIVATPPRIRKARNLHPAPSPTTTPSPLRESPKPAHKLLTRQSSSPQLHSNSNSMANANDARREQNLEGKQQFSPRLLRSNVPEPPVSLHSPTSPGSFKFDLPANHAQMPRRPGMATSTRDSNGSEVHRGLLLLPVSSSKEQTKPKEPKKTSVFKRLYSSAKKRDGKRAVLDDLATRGLPYPQGKLNAKLDLSTRRRSVSLSDLSEICDKLKTCRYLRANSHNEKPESKI